MDKSTTTSPEKTNLAENNEIKPGGSLRAAKDKPGKDNKLCVTNIVLPGPLVALRPPKEDDSPVFKKSRKKKTKDGLVQARIAGNFGPSGGPQIGIKSERGLKRGTGDQMEGPARTEKKRLGMKCPNEPNFC